MKNILVANEYLINNQVFLILSIFSSLLLSFSKHYLHIKWMKALLKNILVV